MDNHNSLYPSAGGQGSTPPPGGQSPDASGYTHNPDGTYTGVPSHDDSLYGSTAYSAGNANGYGAAGQDAWQTTASGAQAHAKYPGWEYYNNAWHAVPEQPAAQTSYYQAAPAAPQPKPKKKRGRGALKVVSLALACLVCGFGGGYAATLVTGTNSGSGAEPAVIYKAPEDSGGSASGVNQADGLSVADIAAKAGASVVSITTENEVRDFYSGGRVVSGAGSGVILTENGYIITNHHVITGAQTIKVTLPNGEEYDATVVGSDARTDIAVVKINVTGLTPAVVGDSDSLKVGEFCLAIGNSMGTLGGTVTNGIISALNREITIENQTMNLLQMNAAVSPGNSGGGLFNDKGELVGIVNAKSSGEDAEGLGFAIPVNTAIQVAESLIANGYVPGRPGLGVTVETITSDEYAMQAGVSAPGVYIASITKGSAADAAGLRVGDRVLTADGVEITTGNELGALIGEKAVGDSLVLEIERDGRTLQVTAVLGELRT